MRKYDYSGRRLDRGYLKKIGLFDKNGRVTTQWIPNAENLIENLFKKYPWVEPGNKKELFYVIRYKLTKRPKCKHCDNSATWDVDGSGYNKHCGPSCAGKTAMKKTAKIMKKKYGVSNPAQVPDFNMKQRATALKRYGYEFWYNLAAKMRQAQYEKNGTQRIPAKRNAFAKDGFIEEWDLPDILKDD